MTDKTFRDKLLNLITLAPDQFMHPGAARLVRDAIQNYADSEQVSFDSALAQLSHMPYYGDGSDCVGGVNIYVHEDGERAVEFTSSDNSTWMNLSGMVHAAEFGVDDWYDPDWTMVEVGDGEWETLGSLKARGRVPG